MPERLYTEYPALYDAIQAGWDYDRDVAFILDILADHDVDGTRMLDIGCGTGEHTRRFVESGFHVTAIDKYEGMLAVAREKCSADFRQMALPDLSLDDQFDVTVALRGVINHLPPEHLGPAFEAIHERLHEGGVVVFDNSPLPPDGNHPALGMGTTDNGDFARIAHHVPTGDGRLEWRSITFTPNGEFFVNSRLMTPFDDETIATALEAAGFDVETHDGFGPDSHRTVFVGVA